MTPNPFLKKLGFSDNDRAVIIHTDDIGMCHASVQAFKDLWAFGTITSGATMVPCPWFPAVAQMCKENPKIDMGVHATLNAEWESYRWGPVSTREQASGLMDADGYFHQCHPAVYQNAKPDGVAKKLFDEVPVGITHFILHPSIDTQELRAIAPDWRARVANYNAFMSDELKKFIEQADIKLIGYRQIRDAMRA